MVNTTVVEMELTIVPPGLRSLSRQQYNEVPIAV